MLFIETVRRAKERPITSLEESLSKLPSLFLEILTRQVEYIIHYILIPLLNSYDIKRDYVSFLNKYYLASRAMILTLLSGYMEKGEVVEFRKFVIDLAKYYHEFIVDMQRLRDVLTDEEFDDVSFIFLIGCEYNLGIANRLAKLEMEVYDFFKRPEVCQLIAYVIALDCVLSSAVVVSAGYIKPDDVVKRNLKQLIKWGSVWADEVFNMCIQMGISHGGNVLEVLPEVKEKLLKEMEEGLEWLALKLSP